MNNKTQTQLGRPGIRMRSAVRAGGFNANHNQTVRVRSGVKAGGLGANHNQTLRVRTGVKAGTIVIEE